MRRQRSRYRFGRTLLPAKALAQMEGFCEMQVHLLYSHYGGGAWLLAQDETIRKGSLLHERGMARAVSIGRVAGGYSKFKLTLIVGGITMALVVVILLIITAGLVSW